MAELLLPTQQVHLNGGNAHGVQSRFHSPTPDQSIAFQVDPNRNITMMKDAVEAITKHLEDVQKEKEDALVQEASNLYTQSVNSTLNEYESQNGENAVKGFEDFQKNITNLDSDFGKTFKNSRLQSDLNKARQNATLNARINGRNWHDKQVREYAKGERLATIQVAGETCIQNMGTPNDKNNFAQLGQAIEKVINVDKGILDKESPQYKVWSEYYYDEAFKDALGAQIEENASMAKVNLERVKGLISNTLYTKYASAIKKEQKRQYAESLQIQALQNNLKEAEEKRINDFYSNELTFTGYENIKKNHKEELLKDYMKENKISDAKKVPQSVLNDIEQQATTRANRDRIAHNARVYRIKNENAQLADVVSDELQPVLQSNDFNIFSPLGNLRKETRDILVFRMGQKKAEDFVRDRAFEMSLNADSHSGDDFFMLTPDEQFRIFNDKQSFDSYISNNKVSLADKWRITQHMNTLGQKMQNGESVYVKPVLSIRDTVVKDLFKKNKFGDLTEPEEKRIVSKVLDKVQSKLNLEYQKTKDPTVYGDPQHILDLFYHEKLYSLPQLKQEIEEFRDTCNDVYKLYDRTVYGEDRVRWTSNRGKQECEQLIKEKGIDFEKKNGRYPTKDELIVELNQYAKQSQVDAERFLGEDRWSDHVRHNALNVNVPEPMQMTGEDYLYQGVTNPQMYDPLQQSVDGTNLEWKLKLLQVFASDLIF